MSSPHTGSRAGREHPGKKICLHSPLSRTECIPIRDGKSPPNIKCYGSLIVKKVEVRTDFKRLHKTFLKTSGRVQKRKGMSLGARNEADSSDSKNPAPQIPTTWKQAQGQPQHFPPFRVGRRRGPTRSTEPPASGWENRRALQRGPSRPRKGG